MWSFYDSIFGINKLFRFHKFAFVVNDRQIFARVCICGVSDSLKRRPVLVRKTRIESLSVYSESKFRIIRENEHYATREVHEDWQSAVSSIYLLCLCVLLCVRRLGAPLRKPVISSWRVRVKTDVAARTTRTAPE